MDSPALAPIADCRRPANDNAPARPLPEPNAATNIATMQGQVGGDHVRLFTCLARIYPDSPVMQGPHDIGVDAGCNVYLTPVLWGNAPWIDPMDRQLIRLRRV